MMFLVGAASAFLAGYGYYQDATVNNTGSNLTNYQVMFVVNTSSGTSSSTTLYLNSHSESDLDDLRFTDTSDNVYDYWIESTSNPYNVWVEVPSITTGNTTVRVQYGNAAASVYSNGTNTFSFFDDFNVGSLDSGKWVAPSDYSISGGEIRLNHNDTNCFLASQNSFNVTQYIVRCRGLRSDISNSALYSIIGGFSTAKNVNHGTYACGFSSWNSITEGLNVLWGTGVGHATLSPDILDNTNYYISEIRKSGSTNYYTVIDSAGTSGGGSSSTRSTSTANNYLLSFIEGTGYLKIDWILIRLYSATVPTVPAWSGESTTSAVPVAAFSANVTSGANPLSVGFTDASTNTPTAWNWSWDDGTANGTTQNPTHSFTSAGTYTIILTAANAVGSDSEEKVDYITVCDTPVAAFHANTTSGYAPLSVGFTDDSTGSPTSWAWSWGDATANGTAQNPSHTYNTSGTYNVTLTATNCGGSDGETKLAYISVYELIAFPGCAAVPTDLDADGLYEDINGNTRKDWADIILFFKYRIWAAANEPPDAFDWNGNGIIDYKDVLMLYDEGV